MTLFLSFLAVFFSPIQDGSERNEMCPVMIEEKSDPAFFSVHEGRKVYFCCEDCRVIFNHEPAKFMAPAPPTPEKTESIFEEARFAPFSILILSAILFFVPGKKARFIAVAGLLSAGVLVALNYAAKLLFLWPDKTYHIPNPRGSLLILGALAVGTVLAWLLPALRKTPQASARKSMAATALSFFAIGAMGFQFTHVYVEDLASVDWTPEEFQAFLHHNIFERYGDPPVPERLDPGPGWDRTYYRGNDDRRDFLWNGGFFRTCIFRLSLRDEKGEIPAAGTNVGGQALHVRLKFERAKNTLEALFAPDLIERCFLTREFGHTLGSEGPIRDRTGFRVIKEYWDYIADYRMEVLPSTGTHRLSGMIYVCEFRDMQGQSGSRFHYAINYDLVLKEGRLSEESQIWMGSLFRNQRMDDDGVTQQQWLSETPIPVAPERLIPTGSK